MKQMEKSTFTAVKCVTISDPSAGRTKIIDCGKPLWAILSEANEEYRKNKKE